MRRAARCVAATVNLRFGRCRSSCHCGLSIIPVRNDCLGMGSEMDRLAAMEAFVRVIEAGSFSGAAKQLRVGQPAVSKTMAQLEDRLGVRLLLRSTHGLTPTDAGRHFYERAKRSIEEAEEAELTARGAAAALTGRLRISAPVRFARFKIVP